MEPLHAAGVHLIRGNQSNCIKLLSVLAKSEDPQLSTVAGPCLALFFREQNLRTSEKVLLGLLEKAKKNMGIILSLVDLYQSTAMPGYALRLLKSASGMYNDPKTLMVDYIQTYLLLNEAQEALPYIKRMTEENYLPQIAIAHLPKVLIAEGFIREFESVVQESPGLVDKYYKAWAIQQDQPNKVAS